MLTPARGHDRALFGVHLLPDARPVAEVADGPRAVGALRSSDAPHTPVGQRGRSRGRPPSLVGALNAHPRSRAMIARSSEFIFSQMRDPWPRWRTDRAPPSEKRSSHGFAGTYSVGFLSPTFSARSCSTRSTSYMRTAS